jgi:hypothetical protein
MISFDERRCGNVLVSSSLLGIAALMPAQAIAEEISNDWRFATSASVTSR